VITNSPCKRDLQGGDARGELTPGGTRGRKNNTGIEQVLDET